MSMPLTLAKALVRFDAERRGSTSAIDAADENRASAIRHGMTAVPGLGSVMGVVVGTATVSSALRSKGVDDGMDPPLTATETIKELGAGSVLPLAANFFGPAGYAVNAAVNLGWAIVDGVQAKAWERIADFEG